MATVGETILARAEDDRPAVVFEDASWSWRQLASAASARAALIRRGESVPAHIGILLDNVPEFMFWLAAAGVSRSVIVGINPTRRGAELERDIRATDCRWIVTDAEHLPLIDGLDVGVAADHLYVTDGPEYAELLHRHADAPPPSDPAEPGDLYMLFFTSGTTGRSGVSVVGI